MWHVVPDFPALACTLESTPLEVLPTEGCGMHGLGRNNDYHLMWAPPARCWATISQRYFKTPGYPRPSKPSGAPRGSVWASTAFNGMLHCMAGAGQTFEMPSWHWPLAVDRCNPASDAGRPPHDASGPLTESALLTPACMQASITPHGGSMACGMP